MIEDALKLSLFISSVATIITAILGTFLGFILAKKKFFGRAFLDALVMLPMILPPTVTGYYLIIILGRRGIVGKYLHDLTGFSFTFTWQGAVVAATIVALPIMLRFAKAAFESINEELEFASYSLGKSKFETFFRVTLPLAKNGLIGGVVLSFARAIGEFGATLMVAGNIPGKTQTMPLAIYEAFITGQDQLAQILVIILTAVSVAVIYLAIRLQKSSFPL